MSHGCWLGVMGTVSTAKVLLESLLGMSAWRHAFGSSSQLTTGFSLKAEHFDSQVCQNWWAAKLLFACVSWKVGLSKLPLFFKTLLLQRLSQMNPLITVKGKATLWALDDIPCYDTGCFLAFMILWCLSEFTLFSFSNQDQYLSWNIIWPSS